MVTRRAVAPVLLAAAALAVTGCNGGGNGKKNSRPDAIVIEPHELSTHLPGDVDFEGRAIDDEDGVLAAAAMAWQILDVDGDVVGAFQGANGTISLLVPGEYTAVLIAEDSDGKTGTYEQPFQIGNTAARISNPDNEDVIPIAQPFDIDGFAETIAPGTELAMMTFIGLQLDDDTQVFSLPVTVPPGNTQYQAMVTPSVLTGRYRIRLEVTTTNPAELAEDNIRVLADAPPDVAITSPANDTTVAPSTSIQFSGTASDIGGGTLAITWTSSIDGELSNELAFTDSSLARAKHRITLTAVDENGLSDSASIDVYIQDLGAPLFVSAPSLPDPDVRAIAIDAGSPDTVWAGTASGLASYASDTVTLGAAHATGYNTNGDGAANPGAACISTGECLFGIAGNGVSIRDAGDTAWSTFAPATGTLVRGIAESAADSYLFFATEQGLTRTDLARANPMAFDTGALNDVIRSVAVDAGGTIWAGTDGGGLVRLQLPSTITAFDEDDGLSNNVVNAIAIDADGNVWAGTEEGLTRFDPVTLAFTRWEDELPDPRVLSLAIAGGVVWIGTEQGAARFEVANDSWTYFDQGDLPGREVNAVALDSSGAVWFGVGSNNGTGGLVRYDGQ